MLHRQPIAAQPSKPNPQMWRLMSCLRKLAHQFIQKGRSRSMLNAESTGTRRFHPRFFNNCRTTAVAISRASPAPSIANSRPSTPAPPPLSPHALSPAPTASPGAIISIPQPLAPRYRRCSLSHPIEITPLPRRVLKRRASAEGRMTKVARMTAALATDPTTAAAAPTTAAAAPTTEAPTTMTPTTTPTTTAPTTPALTTTAVGDGASVYAPQLRRRAPSNITATVRGTGPCLCCGVAGCVQ